MSTASAPRTGSDAPRATRLETAPTEILTARQQARYDRSVAGITGLLQRRPEMRGVYAPADAFDEALRWAV